MHRSEILVAFAMLIAALAFGRLAAGAPTVPRPAASQAPTPIVVVRPTVTVPPTTDPTAPATDPGPTSAWAPVPDADGAPVVQIAILLDTSNSMDGLIDQTRTQLWRIVNEFARSERKGHKPQLQVALYEYGKSTLPNGYMRMIAPFTTDLDRLSEALFALRTRGGEEYCGQVIRDATRDLQWRPTQAGDLKIIFIAGNEPFSQGRIDYRGACRDAAEKGIVVNTIFCGSQDEGARTGWADGAALAGGQFLSINQDQRVVYVAAPQDAEIRRLGQLLNQTYLPYGHEGARAQQRQVAQDAAAAGASSEAAVQRSCAKSNAVYQNATWDLCDALKDRKVDVGSLGEEQLPAAVRSLPRDQRQAYVASRLRERQEIQKKVRDLTEAREQYLRSRSKTRDNSLQAAVLNTIHDQAGKQGYHF